MTTVALTEGWRLTMPRDLAVRTEAIAAALRASADGPVIFYPYMAGFNVALDLPRTGREAVFFPGVVRPYEEASMARDYARAGTLVTCRAATAWDASSALFDDYVPRPLRDAVEPRVSAVAWRDAECRVVRLRPATGR
jgi:hypothetical protein